MKYRYFYNRILCDIIYRINEENENDAVIRTPTSPYKNTKHWNENLDYLINSKNLQEVSQITANMICKIWCTKEQLKSYKQIDIKKRINTIHTGSGVYYCPHIPPKFTP